jgi:hypothetical protein
VGNFVEVKASTIGRGSKANHLAYIGDTSMGAGVNFGAGSITANYDGANKHRTVIEDEASIGSNCVLVAPSRSARRDDRRREYDSPGRPGRYADGAQASTDDGARLETAGQESENTERMTSCAASSARLRRATSSRS